MSNLSQFNYKQYVSGIIYTETGYSHNIQLEIHTVFKSWYDVMKISSNFLRNLGALSCIEIQMFLTFEDFIQTHNLVSIGKENPFYEDLVLSLLYEKKKTWKIEFCYIFLKCYISM